MANLCYFAIDLFVKLGSLVTYLRLTLNRAYVVAINTLQIVVVLFSIICLLTVLLQCVPMSALWGEVNGMCIDTPAFFLITTSITVVINICIYILPLLLTWHVHTSRTNKLWVLLLFGLGTM